MEQLKRNLRVQAFRGPSIALQVDNSNSRHYMMTESLEPPGRFFLSVRGRMQQAGTLKEYSVARIICFLSFFISLSFFITVPPSYTQEIYFHAGEVQNTHTSDRATRWGLAYHQGTGEHTMLSLTYLNEGHLPGHHRDGYAAQFWLRKNIMNRRLSLAAGIGPYAYFDTNGSRAESFDAHGWGGILSMAATWYTDSRFLFQIRGNWIDAVHSFNTLSITGGIGYQLDAPETPGPRRSAPAEEQSPTGNELTVQAGLAVLNRFQSVHTTAEALEYRRGLTPHTDWTIGIRNEGPKNGLERYGVTSQLWLVRAFFNDRVALGAGVGPYFAYDGYRGTRGSTTLSALVGLTGSYRFSRHWAMRFT